MTTTTTTTTGTMRSVASYRLARALSHQRPHHQVVVEAKKPPPKARSPRKLQVARSVAAVRALADP